jgi:hypothetical protein
MSDPQLVRRFDDGRTAIVRDADTSNGRWLIEYADGSQETVNACDTQEVGPDPDDPNNPFGWMQ